MEYYYKKELVCGLPKFQKEVRQNSESNQEVPKEQKETSEGDPKFSEPHDNSSESEDKDAELRRLRRETLKQIRLSGKTGC